MSFRIPHLSRPFAWANKLHRVSPATRAAVLFVGGNNVCQAVGLLSAQCCALHLAKDVFVHVAGPKEIRTNLQEAERCVHCGGVTRSNSFKRIAVAARK